MCVCVYVYHGIIFIQYVAGRAHTRAIPQYYCSDGWITVDAVDK